jgi:glycogen debranching enzyme
LERRVQRPSDVSKVQTGVTAEAGRTLARVGAKGRFAWCGPSLLVTTSRGDCDESEGLSGYFFREARHLRTLRFRINGVAPWLCAEGGSDSTLGFVYVYPELIHFGGGGTDVSDDTTWTDEHGVKQRGVDIRISHRVEPGRLIVIATLGNRSEKAVSLALTWELDADFADIQEAFAGDRQQEADIERIGSDGGVNFRYRHERLPFRTQVSASGGGSWSWADGRLTTSVSIEPRQTLTTELLVLPDDGSGDFDAVGGADRWSAARLSHLAAWRASGTSISAVGEDTTAASVVRQSAADLGSFCLLEGRQDEWLAIQAGIPLYPAMFGRDAITAGWQAAMLDRGDMLDSALTKLGRMQSNRTFEWRDEEPGRIPYQVRAGPLARLDINPYAAYYADFASPLMFVIGLAHLFSWTGDRESLTRHWDTARRILDWARERGDRDGDGYLEYETRSPKGTKNQGWKDSGNAILYEDGRPVPAPLGTCELQGYWFAAQQLMAVMSWVRGEREDAKSLWRSAMDLKARFNRDWWVEDEGFVALALDADKRFVHTVSSNVGHCLASGIIDGEHIPRVVGRLFAPDMFSGWGVRTLSSDHPSFNPLAYHLGSVWPVENATIALGLRRFGFDARALDLAGAMFDLARLYERGRIPECVGGYARREFAHPGAYPRANPIQAWNQSGFLLVLHTLLGLQPVAMLDLLVADPVLPPWLPEITLRNLRLGGATATIRFSRDEKGKSHAEVLHKRGTLHLVNQPPPESLTAGPGERFGGLVESVFH